MKVSIRTFCLGSDDTVYVLSRTRLSAMLDEPDAHPIQKFATMRVRCAFTRVELQGRQRIRMLPTTFAVMEFDGLGILDRERFLRLFVDRNSAGRARGPNTAGKTTLESEKTRAAIARGSWTPSAALAALIENTALGKSKARRL